jgi:hypothetical protein
VCTNKLNNAIFQQLNHLLDIWFGTYCKRQAAIRVLSINEVRRQKRVTLLYSRKPALRELLPFLKRKLPQSGGWVLPSFTWLTHIHVANMADIKELSQEAQYSVQRTIVQKVVYRAYCVHRGGRIHWRQATILWSVLSPQFYYWQQVFINYNCRFAFRASEPAETCEARRVKHIQ